LSTPFQNRLVGTIIVAAAAVIFLPDLLDGKKQKYQADFEAIPSTPALPDKIATPTFPVHKLQKIEVKAGSKTETLKKQLSVQPTAKELTDADFKNNTLNNTVKITPIIKDKYVSEVGEVKRKIKDASTTVKNSNIAVSNNKTDQWVIQLGSYRHEKNVKELVKKLSSNGYNVFIKPIKTKSGNLTKVFVGPALTKASLEKKLSKLKELTKVQGKVSQYTSTSQ
jgi:DedD protein